MAGEWKNILTSAMIPSEERAAAGQEESSCRAEASASELLRARRCIAAVDMDCFYAQCEELRNPALKGKPVGVQQKMLVITSNYAARAFGIAKGDALRVVKEKCPEITICNGEDLTFYGEVSQRVFDLASRFATKVEKLGLDEVFLDLTDLVDERLGTEAGPEDPVGCVYGDEEEVREAEKGCWRRLCAASQICSELRAAILREVGLTSSAGVSVSKLLAKLVSSHRKPDQQTLLLPTAPRLRKLLPDSLPVQRIPGIGFASTAKCAELGVRSLGELVAASDGLAAGQARGCRLLERFDERAVRLMRSLCLGLDSAEVKASGPPKCASAEDSFWQAPLREEEAVRTALRALARKLLAKVRSDERRFGRRDVLSLAVTLRHYPEEKGSSGSGAVAHGRERRAASIAGLRIAADGCPGEAADEATALQVAERAFAAFRKMVPAAAPFALNILNLAVQFGEALPSAQRRLSFAAAATAPAAGERPAKARKTAAAEAEFVVQCSDEEPEAKPAAPEAAAVRELTAMGFPAEEASAALARVGARGLQAAVEELLLQKARPPAPGAVSPGGDEALIVLD